MRVLVACEFSGVVRDAFLKRGHDAISCDLLPSERPGPHHQGDVRDLLHDWLGWDLMIAFPPCTYLCSSGLHWNRRDPERESLTQEALSFVRELLASDATRIALENPVGRIGTTIRPADQIIQPYEYGHDARKGTCLWLKNLPPLKPTQYVEPRWVRQPSGKLLPRWSNQTDSGQNRLPPSRDRWKLRSQTYQGISDAMAEQWGCL